MSRCRSCQAPIVWVETEAKGDKPGRKMPLNADPADPADLGRALAVDNGNIIFTGAHTGDGTPIVRYVPAGPGRYLAHFATCVNAKTHRKPR